MSVVPMVAAQIKPNQHDSFCSELQRKVQRLKAAIAAVADEAARFKVQAMRFGLDLCSDIDDLDARPVGDRLPGSDF